MKIPVKFGCYEYGDPSTSIFLMYKSGHEMHSMQLFIKVEDASTQGQSYLNSPKFYQVTTSCEFNLVQVLENILGGDLVYYEIVGPGPWVTWTTLAKDLKGQQLTLLYHDKPVAHTMTALYGPLKLNTDLKQPEPVQSSSSRINFVHVDETHSKVFNVTETVKLELPSDCSNSTTDSNRSSDVSSDTGGKELESLLMEGNLKTGTYSSLNSHDCAFTLDSQTHVKVPIVGKSNLPEYTQVVNIFPDKIQCAETNSMNIHHNVMTDQNPLEALNDVPCFSIQDQRSSIPSSNTQVCTRQNDSTLHLNQKSDLHSIHKSWMQNTENPDLQNDCQIKQNNLNNLSCEKQASNSQSLFVQNSLDSQNVLKMQDSKSIDSAMVTTSGKMLPLEENAINNATEVDDLSKKLSELPDVDLDISHSELAATSLFIQEQNLQQINVSACSPSVDYVPHTCIQRVHQQHHKVSSITNLSECHNPGAVGTPPPKRHRLNDVTQQQQQQHHHQLHHETSFGKQAQRPNQLQLQQQHISQQFLASSIDIQQQQKSPQFGSSNSVQQQISPQLTTSGNDIQQQQKSPQFGSNNSVQQQQQHFSQFTTSAICIQHQQQMSPQLTSSIGIQQQQTSSQFASNNGVKQQQQALSQLTPARFGSPQQTSQFIAPNFDKQQQQQQESTVQFMRSSVGIQQQQTSLHAATSNTDIHLLQQQKALLQFATSSVGQQQQQQQTQQQQQISPKLTSSNIGIQQLQDILPQYIASNVDIHQHQYQQQQISQKCTSNIGVQKQQVSLKNTSNIGVQQLQQSSPQFRASNVDVQQQQQQQASPQFRASNVDVQQQQQASPQFRASNVDVQQQQQQQASPQFRASNVDVQQQQQQQASPQFRASNVDVQQQQQQQASPQFKTSKIGVLQLQQTSPQFASSSTDMQHQQKQISPQFKISSIGLQQLQQTPQIIVSSVDEDERQQQQVSPKSTTSSIGVQHLQQKYETAKVITSSGQYAVILQPTAANFRNPSITPSSVRSPFTVSVGQSAPAKLPTFEFTVRLPNPEFKPRLNDSQMCMSTKNQSPNTAGSNSNNTSLGSGGRYSRNELSFVLGNEQGSQSPTSQVTYSPVMYKDSKVSTTQFQPTNGSSRSKKEDLSEIIATDEEGYNVIDNNGFPKGQIAGSKWQRPATPQRSGFNLERELLHIEGWSPQENGDTIQTTMEKYRSQDGSFIVWKSRRYNKFIITVSHLNKLLYFRVEETKNGNRDRTVYYLFEGGFRSESLLDLLQHYRQNGLRIPMQYSGGAAASIEHIRLCYPIKPDAKRKVITSPK
ncbi:hypothetical protein BsWGS_11489 [Bradybaena similaris]